MVDNLRKEVLGRLSDEEDSFTERKPESVKAGGIRRTVVAFANSLPDGERGILFLGVADDGRVSGVRNPDALQKRVQDAIADCYPPVTYQCIALPRPNAFIAVVVEASSNRPHFAGSAFVREGSKTVKANDRVFAQLIASRSAVHRALRRATGQVMTLCAWTDFGKGTLAPAVFGQRPGYLNWHVHHARVLDVSEFVTTIEFIEAGRRMNFPIDHLKVLSGHDEPALVIALANG